MIQPALTLYWKRHAMSTRINPNLYLDDLLTLLLCVELILINEIPRAAAAAIWMLINARLIPFLSSETLAAPLEVINLTAEETPENSQRTLVFVGVMTSKDFLETRAKAVYNTWGKLVPGRIAFFSSEGSFSDGK